MALSKAPVSRQAPRSGTASPVRSQVQRQPVSVEDFDLESVEESAEVTPSAPEVPARHRLTVSGVAVSRLQVAFDKDTAVFVPGGSVTERFWDQYDIDVPGKMSRPRAMADADIEVETVAGVQRIRVSYGPKDNYPASVTVITHPNLCVNFTA